jgi:hypothetical protein
LAGIQCKKALKIFAYKKLNFTGPQNRYQTHPERPHPIPKVEQEHPAELARSRPDG